MITAKLDEALVKGLGDDIVVMITRCEYSV